MPWSKDSRREANEYDPYAIGVYRQTPDEQGAILVGHAPTEISPLLFQFLEAEDHNRLIAIARGKRKRSRSSRKIKNSDDINRGIYELENNVM